MATLRKRVSALPDQTAILYTAIYSDGAGTYFPPADALAMFAETANRPIIAPVESSIGRGAVGGYCRDSPAVIGEEAAQTALQIIDGTSPAAIPVARGNSLRPVFDWRELQRWGMDEGKLPARQRSAVSRAVALAGISAPVCRNCSRAAAAERPRRSSCSTSADVGERPRSNSHARMNELAHVNRQATAGELTASIAHELNQPLGAILCSAETAELLLESPNPNLEEIKEILADIRRDDLRASEVIKRLRRLLKKAQLDVQEVDLNRDDRGGLRLCLGSGVRQ